MEKKNLFKWKHYQPDLILLTVRWYLRYNLSFRDLVEQDHLFIKKRVRSMLGLKSFRTATYIISGIEAMHMVKKRQLVLLDKSVQNQVNFIHQLFGIATED
ncbi:DDE-type integrase/transposase/recombinase [Bacillus sp. CGMCC 1.60114]|uniref:DDE-type integrase/transposase/recombinase n=1 Tax=unclassified Bacillus (in: firmicutes) TaxID=185979 RepID=UPI0036270BE4